MEEENKVRKFKLIDKQGYISNHSSNATLLYRVNSEIFSGIIDQYEGGHLINRNISNTSLISEDEFQFFEEITDEQETSVTKETSPAEETLYWQEGQPLTAGLIVGKNCSGDREFFVKYVGDYYVVLSDKREETTSAINNLRSLVKSDKDVIFDEVLSLWKSQSLSNACDNKSSVVNLGSFFDTVYQVMKGES